MTNDKLRLLNEKFRFMGFLDYGRWNGYKYSKPNMAFTNASEEEVLLTHFLGYITNRQTPFEMIFDRLDYIFSQIVRDYVEGASVEKLLSPEQFDAENGSYFVQKPIKGKRKKTNQKQDKEDTYSYAFVSHRHTYKGIEFKKEESQSPAITEELLKEHNGFFYASSRFYPTDYIAIRSVLDILDKMFDRSFFKFINSAIGYDKTDRNDHLERLLYALWILGYKDVGQWDIETIISVPPNRNKEYIEMLDEKKASLFSLGKYGLKSYNYKVDFSRGSQNSNRFKAKRVICYLRDLLKCKPYYVERFKECLGESLFDVLYSQIPDSLELPGDTWNNNDSFQKCLDIADDCHKKKSDFPNVRIRNRYSELKDLFGKENVGCYPEQFDCSFDFVPRMCNAGGKRNCPYCPISIENMKKHSGHLHIPEEFCHKDKDKFCPFLLYAAGYKIKCGVIDEKVCPNKKKQ